MWKKLFRPVKAKKRTGVCLCGCGGKTPLATVTRNERGDVRGYPVRYIYGHNTKDPEWRKGVPIWTRKTNWNGGKTIHQGYVLRHKRTFTKRQYNFLKPMFLKYNKRGVYVPEHRALVALKEKRLLLSNEFVRHLDGNRSNNSEKNLLLGSAKDNYLDHDTARKEVIRLKNENLELLKIIQRLHQASREGFGISHSEVERSQGESQRRENPHTKTLRRVYAIRDRANKCW